MEKNIRIARWLAAVGLLPFFACALLAWQPHWRDWAAHALASYAAIVITFNGAVHWGRALAQFQHSNQLPTLLFSIMPSLLGWFALMLPLELAIPMLTAGLMFTWGTEQMVFIDALPDWYRTLRHALTAAAVVAMLLGWLAVMMPMF